MTGQGEVLTAQARLEQFRNALSNAREAIYGGVAVAAAVAVGMGSAPEQAVAQADVMPDLALPAPSLKITATFGNKQASAESVSNGSITVLENMRASGTPKAAVRRAEARQACFDVGKGTEHPVFWNKGRNVSKGEVFGKDTRKSRVCRIGGKLIRVLCDNEVRLIEPSNSVKTPVVFVRSFAHTKLQVKAKAFAVAKCETAGASAYAVAEASASGSVYARTFVTGKGRGKTTAAIAGEANGKASALAKVRVSCKGEEVVILTKKPPVPMKPPYVCNPDFENCNTPPPPPPPPNNPPPPPPPPPPVSPPPPPQPPPPPTIKPPLNPDCNIDVCN